MGVSVFHLLFIAALSLATTSNSASDQCVYTIYVRTGSVIKGGTDSKIRLSMGDAKGRQIQIWDLETLGLMEAGHDYYERGNLDIFSGRGPCLLDTPLCSLNVTSDGSGSRHGWYCEYVEVTSTGPRLPCSKTLFHVRQWLATDASPYRLHAFVDLCRGLGGGGGGGADA
ncbi:hypothetical protein QJS10_CPB11g00314 [Acorus calamus]|uniref:PLAT domain-containing protein n=1 Tax=Acorus calamus TaxID=4465 RepID=A0AAV9DUQ5_ACOCL|nr:hypothetical protein QJS10_CPB11g00314 [Acorus calamus]